MYTWDPKCSGCCFQNASLMRWSLSVLEKACREWSEDRHNVRDCSFYSFCSVHAWARQLSWASQTWHTVHRIRCGWFLPQPCIYLSFWNYDIPVKQIEAFHAGFSVHLRLKDWARTQFHPLPLIKPVSLTFYWAVVLPERARSSYLWGFIVLFPPLRHSIQECTCLLHLPDQDQEV